MLTLVYSVNRYILFFNVQQKIFRSGIKWYLIKCYSVFIHVVSDFIYDKAHSWRTWNKNINKNNQQ